ncbi:hypothetical protein AB1N83_010110 [Pleurotus pulmonarius]
MAKARRAKRKSLAVSVEMDMEELSSSSSGQINASAMRTSADGRRVYRHNVAVPTPSPSKRQCTHSVTGDIDAADPPSDELGPLGDERLWIPVEATSAISSKYPAKRYTSSDEPLKEWQRSACQEYLMEFVRLEGPGAITTSKCGACDLDIKDGLPYRCKDCFSGLLLCEGCLLRAHYEHPLHVIEKWDGRCFKRSTLRDAGLIVQLGHTPGEACACYNTVNEFVVLHVNGIHVLTIRFCACDEVHGHGSPRQQLLRRRWFPATFEQPQTSATFRLLEHFHMQTLQGKVTIYDYYSALQKLTDNTGLERIPIRYKEFVRMKREYAHLKSLKRAGRGHDTTGVAGTKNGELTVRCPACPSPGINLPKDWQFAPEEKQFLYTLFIALDACFRLKRRMVSSVEKDPGLGIDWGYFVEAEPFRQYLLSVTDQKEMSTCSGLAALDYANTKFSRGYAATGVCLGVCARHEFIQPNGAADLQVGERYANMDYAFASLMRHHKPEVGIVVSYDIACQWSKSILERLKKLPSLVRLGVLLLKRLKSAIAERGVQQASFEIFAGQQGSRVEMWKKMVKEFEADGSKPNPYEVPKTGLTENDVRLQFAREESTAETDGGVMPHKVTRSGFISEGLDIEEQQQRARSTIHEKKTGTTVQQADIIDIRTRLTRSITHFRMLQAVYLPMALTELSARVVPEGEEAEAVPVILPSSLSSEGRAQCDQRLLEVERRLREARCQSALDDLRNLLFVKSRLVSYKDRNVRHQAANTRARTLINRNESKIKLQALKYETSRSALKTLAGGDEKGLKWPALKPEHIRCMEDPDTTKKKEVCNVRASESGRDDVVVIINEGKQGSEEEEGEDRAVVACEGYRTISWIWMDAVGRGSANGEEMDAVLRCEFAKSWARARRWAEEVELLREEMRRTIVTLRGRARLWEARAMDDWSQFGPDYVQGLCAYAFSQADLLSRLAQKYEHTWTGIGGNVDDAESDADLERDLQNQQHEERVEEAEEGR